MKSYFTHLNLAAIKGDDSPSEKSMIPVMQDVKIPRDSRWFKHAGHVMNLQVMSLDETWWVFVPGFSFFTNGFMDSGLKTMLIIDEKNRKIPNEIPSPEYPTIDNPTIDDAWFKQF